jgi:cell division septation protein DedD
MQIDIPAHIEKLLFLHDTLNIPDFGGFTAVRAAASVDYVGGTVNPPNKSLSFSENLTLDDGILVEDIASTHGISYEDARHALADFVEKMRDLLNQREIVTLPGVGRLYKNYVQKIQFLPDSTNYSTESFGLSPLQFSPIARSREVSEKAPDLTPTATAVNASKPVAAPDVPVYTTPIVKTPARSNVWLVAGSILLVLGMIAGVWWLRAHIPAKTPLAKVEKEKSEKPLKSVPEAAEPAKPSTKTNVAPIVNKPATPKGEDLDKQVKASVAQKVEEARRETLDANKKGRLCVLIIATLQEKANADRTIQTLKKAGYEVYVSQKKGYQVGIQFKYQNIQEIQQKIIALQDLTGAKEIWIKQK